MSRQHTPLEQYHKLLHARNRFTFGLMILSSLTISIYLLLNHLFSNQGLAFVLTMIVGILGFIFVVFRFLMKDICPWCKQNFFFQNNGAVRVKGFDLFFQKHCNHCHEPKQNIKL